MASWKEVVARVGSNFSSSPHSTEYSENPGVFRFLFFS